MEEQLERRKRSWKGDGKAARGSGSGEAPEKDGKATKGLEKMLVEGVWRGRNREIAGKMEKPPGCIYVCVREKNHAKGCKSSQKD